MCIVSNINALDLNTFGGGDHNVYTSPYNVCDVGGATMCIVIITKALDLNSFVGGRDHNACSNHYKSTRRKQFCRGGTM